MPDSEASFKEELAAALASPEEKKVIPTKKLGQTPQERLKNIEAVFKIGKTANRPIFYQGAKRFKGQEAYIVMNPSDARSSASRVSPLPSQEQLSAPPQTTLLRRAETPPQRTLSINIFETLGVDKTQVQEVVRCISRVQGEQKSELHIPASWIEFMIKRIAQFAEVFKAIPNPRKQFVDEIFLIYDFIAKDNTKIRHPEDRLIRVVEILDAIKQGKELDYMFSKKKFPLLWNVINLIKPDIINIKTFDKNISVATSEIMQEIDRYLQELQIPHIRPPKPSGGVMRKLAETKGELKKVQPQLAEISPLLQAITSLLPDSPQTAASVQTLATQISSAKGRNFTDKQIIDSILANLQSYL